MNKITEIAFEVNLGSYRKASRAIDIGRGTFTTGKDELAQLKEAGHTFDDEGKAAQELDAFAAEVRRFISPDTTPASSLPVVGKVTLAEKYAQPPDTILADKKNTKPQMIADAKTLEVEADLDMSMNRSEIIAKIKAALEGKAEPEVEVEVAEEPKSKPAAKKKTAKAKKSK